MQMAVVGFEAEIKIVLNPKSNKDEKAQNKK